MKAPAQLLLLSATWLLAASTAAADLKVLTAGALKPVVSALAPAFERTTGDRLVIDADTAGALVRRVQAGEAFDVVVVNAAGLEALAKDGRVAADSSLALARIGIGIAVRPGTTTADIGTVAGFRQALLNARAVAFIDPAAGGSSGIYVAKLFERLGIAEEMRRKSVLVTGGLVGQRLVDGDADLALQQMSELLAVPGITVLGPIPADVQNYTVYAGAVGAASRDRAGAKAFLAMVSAATAAGQWKAKGIEAP